VDETPEAVILCGVQGAGKTTFYREWYSATHIHVSLDELGTRAREQALVEECLAAGRSFVVDNTNPQPLDRARYVAPSRAAGFRVVACYVDAQGETRLAAQTQQRLVRPHRDEGFDEVARVVPLPGFRFSVRPLPEQQRLV
jgi:predicted kinase